MKLFVMPLLVVSVASFSGAAAAQISQTGAPREAVRHDDEAAVTDASGPSYTVNFKDDAVAAGLVDGSIPRIKVRPAHGYGQLSRPRLQFVTEMLKSVEVM